MPCGGTGYVQRSAGRAEEFAQAAGWWRSSFFRRAVLLAGFAATVAVAQETAPTIRKTVDNARPMPGEPVTFEIVVSNATGAATGRLEVDERLPPGMAIPSGMAAFVSTGEYDAEEGRWVIGELDDGAVETMLLPAIVTASPQPGCLVNTARLLGSFSHVVDSAAAALLAPGVERCADVAVVYLPDLTYGTYCGVSRSVYYTIRVDNKGPDEARDVVLSVEGTSGPWWSLGPTAACSGVQCRWATIPAGSSRSVTLTSTSLTDTGSPERQLRVTVTAADADPDPQNDVEVGGGTLTTFTDSCPGLPDSAEADYFSDGGGGCFIATAAYGTPFDARIEHLRRFRDQTLSRSAAGRAFIAWYYRYAPPVAAYIEPRPRLRSAVRGLLTPVVLAVAWPRASSAAVLVLLATSLAVWRMRRRPPHA